MEGDVSASTAEKACTNDPPANLTDAEVNEANSELETIDSDEEVIEGDDEEAEGRTRSKICYNCRLLFVDYDAMKEHEKSENHEMVKMGFKPSVGAHYCYLCWDGFKDPAGLSAHLASLKHEQNVARCKVKAVCSSDDVGEPSRKRPRLDFPDVVPHSTSRPSDLGAVQRLNRDEWICKECNVVFVTYLNAKVHSKSPNHLAVLEGQYPQLSGRQSGDKKYYCFVCWFGCDSRTQIVVHNSTQRHFRQMKNTGVARLFAEEPPDAQKEDADNFIVLDEVKGSDDEQDGDGDVDNTLDEVSSDEETLGKVEPALGLDDLEDVDSEEEKIEEVGGLEDVDSSEDEVMTEKPTSSVVNKLPEPPPPPIISSLDLRSNRSKHSLSKRSPPRERFDSINNLKPVPASVDSSHGSCNR